MVPRFLSMLANLNEGIVIVSAGIIPWDSVAYNRPEGINAARRAVSLLG
jgi:hypothetical protein